MFESYDSITVRPNGNQALAKTVTYYRTLFYQLENHICSVNLLSVNSQI